MVKKLYWYVVYWRNKKFLRTRFKPNKLGAVIGMEEQADRFSNCYCRLGLDKNSKDFKIVEKYAPICHKTKAEFKKWIADDRS